ncbi:ABC transporter permease [Actinacidiphila oryziradicis]|uniref:ABC transporter permease n=1 Tax=Actinacidiphila oryziradicis TaxID=2571141 RepID=UPI0023F49F64|nr:ABC transporter permease [Actinacidiphila oryziradicis]
MSTNTNGPAKALGRTQRPQPGRGWTRRLAETPEIGVITACIAVFLGVWADKNRFADPGNLSEMSRNLAEFGILALGESLVILTGGIDLSVGALAALSGVFSAWLFVQAGLPLALCILLTILLCAAVGAMHGLFVTRLNVPPFVITLVTFTAARGGAEAITHSVPISISGQAFMDLSQQSVLGIPLPALVFVLVAAAAWFFLERMYLGRQTYAVGGNAEAARLAGVNVGRRVMWTYVTSAVLAGIVGILIAGRLGLGDPSVANGYELDAIAAAVIGGVSLLGGQGRVIGIVAGSVLLVIINDALIVLNVSPYYQQIVLGAVLGVAITIDRVRAKRLGRARRLVRARAGRAIQPPAEAAPEDSPSEPRTTTR